MIESRRGKWAVVCLLLILSAVLATSRPKKPQTVYPTALILGLTALGLAWRVKSAPPIPSSFPLGDPQAFIASVPRHVSGLEGWADDRGLQRPPLSLAAMEEWLWSNREALGQEWPTLMQGLTAAYGEALRAADASRHWSVRKGEPAIVSSAWMAPARSAFAEVHDAVFADL